MTTYFLNLPISNISSKKINIFDHQGEKNNAYIQRCYKHPIQKILTATPLVDHLFEKVNIYGERSSYKVSIIEKPFRQNLRKMKWDVVIHNGTEEKTYLLEDITKVSTNPRFLYHQNNREILWKKDILNRTTIVSFHDSKEVLAEITIIKMMPIRLEIKLNTDIVNEVEIAAIYYTMFLSYKSK
jgi:hypothetical protein